MKTNSFLKHSIPVLITNFLFVIAISPVLSQTPKGDSSVAAGSQVNSILESTAQWNDLFNGENLEGWKGDTAGYLIEDGTLICKKGGKNLATNKEYSDFAFHFEFKLEESGNNGIGIRGPESARPSKSGLEIQILDDGGRKYNTEVEVAGNKRKLSWLKPWQYHGSVYGVVPAKHGYLKPAGEWNSETIIAIEDHIIVMLNGAVIVDAFLNDVTPLDGEVHPGLKIRRGPIQLIGHSDRVEFRDLRVADYSRSPTRPASSTDNQPPAGFVTLFNGEDLNGWKGLADRNATKRLALKGKAIKDAQAAADDLMRKHWRVADGILTYDGKGQSLCTSKDYGDFEFYIDWKIPPGADSGIYLRGTPQVQIWDPWDPRIKEGVKPLSNPEDWVIQYKNGRNLGSGGLWNNKRLRNSPTVLDAE